jgi:aerobic carbon-monoxide dehydrogenase large subunit
VGVLPNAVNDALAPFGVIVDRQPPTPMYLASFCAARPTRSN